MEFPQFASLPVEIQLQVWEALTAGPAMHIFDVCFPSSEGASRAQKAFGLAGDMDDKARERYRQYEKTVFLDCLDTSDEENSRPTRVAKYTFDPSMYRLMSSLATVNKSASATAQRVARTASTNTVYLPGRSRKVSYPDSDVLMLRFRDGGAATQAAAHMFPAEADMFRFSSISDVLESQWSTGMAETLQNAKKVALDVSETWVPDSVGGETAFEEIMYLACTLQNDLEVLYLVDNCVGRCKGCRREGIWAHGLQTRGELFNGLHYQNGGDTERTGDVIEAVSKRYVEVFDLERLGWADEHPTYVFARMIDEAIRTQQRGSERDSFQGVRVLVVEDEEMERCNTSMAVDCRADAIAEFSMDMIEEMSRLLLPALAGVGLITAEPEVGKAR